MASLLETGQILVGLAALTAGATLLVAGAVRLAARLGISPLVVGLTVVAFGTSAPELAVSVRSTLAGHPDVAIGNVVGSNIFNVLVILGLAALVAPLAVSLPVIRRELPLMIAVSGLVWATAALGWLGHASGALLILGLGFWTVWQVIASRRATRAEPEQGGAPAVPTGLGRASLFVGAGLALLVGGATWFVDGSVALARNLGISESVIGATIVAAGTSLPELATSVAAGLKRQADLAVGNVVGSNLFNLLGVLGASAAVGGTLTLPEQSLALDMPVMVLSALVCWPIFRTGRRVSRSEGGVLLLSYGAYVFVLLQR